MSRSIAQAQRDARSLGLDRVDTQALLSHLLGRDRAWLLTHDDHGLSAEQDLAFASLCQRRLAGEPVAYLVGEREFHGLALQVSPAVLIPRPDTEVLVDWALRLLETEQEAWPRPQVLDLGTGSGAIALAVKHRYPGAQLTAVDASAAALAQARSNGQRLGLAVDWREGNWWQPVAGQRFDLVLSNPPYIADADPHLDALRFEPRSALSSGPDGLDDLRHLIAQAPAHLHRGAWLLLEHGWDQADAVQALLHQAGFGQVHSEQDLGGHRRCTGGRWPGA